MSRVSNPAFLVAAASSVVSIASLVLLPLSSSALGIAPSSNVKSQSATSPFCTNLSTEASTITSKFATLQGKITQAWTQQNQNLTSEWQKVDQTVAADRQKADSERTSDFTKLESKATTASQKQAVQTYEAAVNAGVSTRRGAYDGARQVFRSGVQSLVNNHQATVTTQITTFKTSMNGAISTAEASCASTPTEGTTIRQAFVASLKTARETFQSDRKADGTLQTQVQQLAATRNATFKAADQVFQTSITNARQALQQAFGKTTV